jgi:hypothetical protein
MKVTQEWLEECRDTMGLDSIEDTIDYLLVHYSAFDEDTVRQLEALVSGPDGH